MNIMICILKPRLLLSFAVVALTAQPGFASTLTSPCNQSRDHEPVYDTNACRTYINGFLDGAEITDTAIIKTIRTNPDTPSSFFERAYRTRVGASKQELPATYFAKYCLPNSMDRNEVINILFDEMKKQTDNESPLNSRVYMALKTRFPCETL